jgi:hypothetical protein
MIALQSTGTNTPKASPHKHKSLSYLPPEYRRKGSRFQILTA